MGLITSVVSEVEWIESGVGSSEEEEEEGEKRGLRAKVKVLVTEFVWKFWF